MLPNSLPVYRKCRVRVVLIYSTVALVFLALLMAHFFPEFYFWRKAVQNVPGSPVGLSPPEVATCLPKHDIFFLKTHKCASSTVQNVLLRYGHRSNLNFVLPTLGNYLGNQAPFMRQMTAMAPWHQLGYNIFCHHTVFDEREVAAIMPNDTAYVSIVREPVALFESLYSYAKLDKHYGLDLTEFALRAEPGDAAVFTNRAEGYLGLNQMAYDFGLRPAYFGNATLVEQWLERLERRFDLVLVAEHFDESMVLLADFLCWPLEDVTYFRHNARRAERRRPLTADVVQRLERLNEVDTRLYRHFNKRFWRQVRRFGFQRMRRQVALLQRLNARWQDFCLSGAETTVSNLGNSSFRGLFTAFSDQVENLVLRRSRLSNSTCHYMAKSEIAFTNQLKMSQVMKAMRQLGTDAIQAGLGRGAPIWLGLLSQEIGFVALNATGRGGAALISNLTGSAQLHRGAPNI